MKGVILLPHIYIPFVSSGIKADELKLCLNLFVNRAVIRLPIKELNI